jgi:hypothetical protein
MLPFVSENSSVTAEGSVKLNFSGMNFVFIKVLYQASDTLDQDEG